MMVTHGEDTPYQLMLQRIAEANRFCTRKDLEELQ